MLLRSFLSASLLLATAFAGRAQDDLFGSVSNAPEVKSAFLIGAHYDINKPIGDLANRFGSMNRLGGSLQYRLPSNWQFGVQGTFLFTNTLTEDSLLYNLKDVSGFYLDNDGRRVGMEIAGRGYQVGLTAGKMFPLNKNNPNSGILVQLAGGFIQHKVFYYNQQDNFAQLRGDYKKGYDRLTNGLYVEPYVGYQYFSSNRRVLNFHIGVVAMMGFTEGRRDWQFDLQRPDKASRFDGMVGIRAGWYIPVYRKLSEEVYF